MQENAQDRVEEGRLEEAEAHLTQAEAQLERARAEEEAAEREVGDALREVDTAAHRHREIHFVVNGEPEETERREMTPNEIMSEYGHEDPATNYRCPDRKRTRKRRTIKDARMNRSGSAMGCSSRSFRSDQHRCRTAPSPRAPGCSLTALCPRLQSDNAAREA